MHTVRNTFTMPYASSVMCEHAVTEAVAGISEYPVRESGEEGCRLNHSKVGVGTISTCCKEVARERASQ